MKHKPTVTIVIPAYNAEKTIGKTLVACQKQDYPEALYDILVVDDGSTDNTAAIVASCNAGYVRQENSGPAAARNHGCRIAQGAIVAFLDSDCVPRPTWLTKMIRHYSADDFMCVGSRYGIANPSNLLACCIYFEFLIRYKRMPHYPKFLGSHGYSFRKDFLLNLGGYCEEYTMASHEDNELVYRIVTNGYYPLFDKTNIVDHFFPTNLYRYLRIQMWHGFWRMKLYVHHPHMVTGDDYSDIWDYLQPPLMLLFLASLPFIWIEPLAWFCAASIAATCLLQLPIATRMVRLVKKKRYFLYLPFGVARAFARSIGMVMGMIHFWFLRNK